MKPINLFSLFAFTAIVMLIACKNAPKQPTVIPASETTLPTPPPSPKPEVYIYMVSVDKPNLRDQSNKNGKVITQFPLGDYVEGIGEVSANKEEATLRGIPYNEPYFKVTSTTPDQITGWAYSAGLEIVYAGPRTTIPDLGKLSSFARFLKTLDVKKIDSGNKAWTYVAQNLASAQGTLSDATFIILEKFLFRMETEGSFYELTDKIKWMEPDYEAITNETFDMNKYPATKILAENGFKLAQGEGMVFPVVDLSKLGAAFATKVTPPMKNYVEQSILEQKDMILDDDGIVIPLEQVADRAAWWEKFNLANPYFVLSEETQNAQHSLLFFLICGANNTPVFQGENELVSEDFKKAWAYVQQKYAETELGRSVKEMSDLVTTSGGKRTQKVNALMEKYLAVDGGR